MLSDNGSLLTGQPGVGSATGRWALSPARNRGVRGGASGSDANGGGWQAPRLSTWPPRTSVYRTLEPPVTGHRRQTY